MTIFLPRVGTTHGRCAFQGRDDATPEGAMSNLSQNRPLPPAARQEASKFTLAVVMSGIAAFFIACIALAFIYSKDASPVQKAEMQQPPMTAKAPPETTGSGTSEAK
jgi:hypothetical protein